MKNRKLQYLHLGLMLGLLFMAQIALAQNPKGMVIGDTELEPSAILELESNDQGFLLPRLNNIQRGTIPTPIPPGLMIYNTDEKVLNIYSEESWQVIPRNFWSKSSSNLLETEFNAKVNGDFEVNGASVLSGDVGIGTATPNEALQIGNFTNLNNYILLTGALSNSTNLGIKFRYSTDNNLGFALKSYLNEFKLVRMTSGGDENELIKVREDGKVNFRGESEFSRIADFKNGAKAEDFLEIYSSSQIANPPVWKIEINEADEGHPNLNLPAPYRALMFKYNDELMGYLRDNASVGAIDFTAQHRNLPSIGTAIDYKDKIGRIVSSDGTIYNLDGSKKPTISESLPHVKMSDKAYDKSIYGVIADIEKKGDGDLSSRRNYTLGIFSTSVERVDENDYRLVINSGGEGGVWVSNYNGNIENGDLIVTSPIPGIGMKQEDDLLHNYTVAKVVMDCNFDLHSDQYECKEVFHNGKVFRMAFLACVYKCN